MGWYGSEKANDKLRSELATLRKNARISAVQKSVSAQMEEIATQQKEISDEQREEALQQTRLANQLREQSEEERRNAIIAQNIAIESEQKALDAYDQAEQQRLMAEAAKRRADTLNYITLGRSLGSLATKQYLTGNYNLASILGYASYLFTNRYHGDLYNPSVFQALTLTSQSKREWDYHEGAIMNLDIAPTDDKVVTVSNYGEIVLHEKKGDGSWKSEVLFKNKQYDFRDVWMRDNGNIYAVSRTGHLVILSQKGTKILELKGMQRPMKLSRLGTNSIVIAEDAVALFDNDTYQISDIRKLNFRVICSSKVDDTAILFDDKGRMHHMKSLNSITTRKVPVVGTVSDYDASSSLHYQVFGMTDGTVFLVDKDNKIRRLVGHRSRISKVKVHGRRIYTASYDGTLNLWISDSEKPEPITLYSDNSWIMHFSFDKSRNYLWVGDQKGNLVQAMISIPMMAEKIHKSLKRGLTQEEWNYYIGKNVKYDPFLTFIK